MNLADFVSLTVFEVQFSTTFGDVKTIGFACMDANEAHVLARQYAGALSRHYDLPWDYKGVFMTNGTVTIRKEGK